MRRSLVLLFLAACGSTTADQVRPDAQPGGAPTLGAHGLTFHRIHGDVANISSDGLSTQSGSTLLVFEGRGDISQFSLPTDNKGNSPYRQLGDSEPYIPTFPNSGTGSYAFTNAAGGSGHVVTARSTADDEITLAVVEVVNGQTIADFKWNEVNRPDTVRSESVTTTGPATLVAVWWGDSDVQPNPMTAQPNNGFTVIDSVLAPGALVQCSVATKNVSEAGTYDVTWTATPSQGAQMWLVAIQ